MAAVSSSSASGSGVGPDPATIGPSSKRSRGLSDIDPKFVSNVSTVTFFCFLRRKLCHQIKERTFLIVLFPLTVSHQNL